MLETKTNKDGQDGWIFSAKEYTTYDIQVTRPEGTTTVITKRYSDFDELKAKLAATEVRRRNFALRRLLTVMYTPTHPCHETLSFGLRSTLLLFFIAVKLND